MPEETSKPISCSGMINGSLLGALGGVITLAVSKIPGTAFTHMTNPDAFGKALGAGAGAGAILGAISSPVINLIALSAYGAGKAYGAGIGSEKAGTIAGVTAGAVALIGAYEAISITTGALEKALIPHAFTGSVKETALSHWGAANLSGALVLAVPASAIAIAGTCYGIGAGARGVRNVSGLIKNTVQGFYRNRSGAQANDHDGMNVGRTSYHSDIEMNVPRRTAPLENLRPSGPAPYRNQGLRSPQLSRNNYFSSNESTDINSNIFSGIVLER